MSEFCFAPLKKPREFRSQGGESPANWNVLEGLHSSGKIIVDVGCGKGESVINAARSHPGHLYIGIEKTHTRSKALLEQTRALNLPNLISLQADAVKALDAKLSDHSVDEFYFFYPNPWPKKKQANKRYLVGSCFWIFDRLLKKGGRVYLATNIKGYAEEAASFLKEIWQYPKVVCQPLPRDCESRTAFERKYRDRGEVVYEVEAVKI